MSIVHVAFYPSDWLAGTRGLSAEETGVYITLIARIYEMAGPIERDDNRLSRLCGCASRAKFAKALEYLISEGKIQEHEGQLFNERAQKEIQNTTEKSSKAKAAAQSRWNKKPNKINGGDDANAFPKHASSICQSEPESESERKKEPPADAAGTDFLKGKPAKGWLWSDGVDHLVRTTDKSEQQAKSAIGHLLKMCDEKPERLVKYFIEALEQGSTSIVDHCKAQIGRHQSSKASGSDHIPVIAVRCTDDHYKALQDRHQAELGKKKFLANGVSHFPKTWIDELSTVSGNA